MLRGLPEINFLGDPSMTLSLFNQYIPNQTFKNMRFWAHSIFIPISEWTYTPSSQRCHHVFGGENSGACRDGCRFCGLTYTQMTFLPVKMWMSLPFLFLAMQIDLLQVQFLVACAYVISLICAAYIYIYDNYRTCIQVLVYVSKNHPPPGPHQQQDISTSVAFVS